MRKSMSKIKIAIAGFLLVAAIFAAGTAASTEEQTPATTEKASPDFDAAAAERFAKLTLACVHKEYPNKVAHVLSSDADVAAPRKLPPAVRGCSHWHWS